MLKVFGDERKIELKGFGRLSGKSESFYESPREFICVRKYVPERNCPRFQKCI